MKTKRMIELAAWADVIHFQVLCVCFNSINIMGAITGTPVRIMIGMIGRLKYLNSGQMTITGITMAIVLVIQCLLGRHCECSSQISLGENVENG